MKIAGRKNDSAWFRTNKAIHSLGADERADLISGFQESLALKGASMVADLTSLAAECGVTLPAELADFNTWAARVCTVGVPRQIWNGRLSFTTYGRTGVPGAYKYPANYQSSLHYFAKDMRRFLKYWFHGRRALNDLADVGAGDSKDYNNPGGLPDAQVLA